MLNFEFKKSSRKCYQSDKEFKPGDGFYSTLLECEGGQTERRDYASDQWEGPPENCIGWWKSSVPELGKGRVYWAPKKVLIAYFEHLQTSEQTGDIAFVTGLLLMQKKILTQLDSELGEPTLKLHCRSTNTTYPLSVVEISPERLAAIQEELAEKLFVDQPFSDDTESEEANGEVNLE
jgi:hypothetical protein